MAAEAALSHAYFRSLGERVHQLEDSEYPGEAGGGAGVTPEPKTGGGRCGGKSWDKEAQQPGPPLLGVLSVTQGQNCGIWEAACKAQLGAPGPALNDRGSPASGRSVGVGAPVGSALSLPFSSLPTAASIFSLKEIQLQKDPGYRGLAFQQPGRGSCLPHPLP